MKVVVTGAGGFIGSHLAKRLKSEDHQVIGIDVKKPEPFCDWSPEITSEFFDDFHICDLTVQGSCDDLLARISSAGHIDRLYHLAANMGGIGFIETHKAEIVRDNTLININTIEAARREKVGRFLFTSSACVYPAYLQGEANVVPLREKDAYPAMPEDGYGWEKLMMERVCRHYREDFGLETRIVRFHNVFGPYGTWNGGREKAPAAICRKVALADKEIEIWGDGEQTRSFLYIDDCIEGLLRIMESNYQEPLNLGQDRMVTINELVSMVKQISGKYQLDLRYNLDAPKGVRGRNSDNRLITEFTGWKPAISLERGLDETYRFIVKEISRLHPGFVASMAKKQTWAPPTTP